MAKKKVTKASKRRLLCFGVISIFVMVYFFISLSYYAYNIYSLQNEQENLEQQLITLQKNEQDLKIEIEKLKDPDYLARYARENYSYSKDGELVIKLNKTVEKAKQAQEKFDFNFYLFCGGGVILFFIILYVIRKKK